MTELHVVPDLPDTEDGGDGEGPGFDELMLMAQRILESAISKIDWDQISAPLARNLVVDPEDARTISRLCKVATIAVYFEEGLDG